MNGATAYEELEIYLPRILETIVSLSFSTLIVKLRGSGARDPVRIRSPKTAFDDRGPSTGTVFRIKHVDPLDRFLPTGPGHSLNLEPCCWDEG